MVKRQSVNHVPMPLVIGMILAIVIKVPILFLVMFLALFFYGGFMLVRSGIGDKKKAIKPGSPKVVKIDGVGEIEWITDIRQLDHKRLLGVQGIKKLEDEVLRCAPSEWITMGEKVAVSEEEAANKPEPSYMPPSGHPWDCRCQKCHEHLHNRAHSVLNQQRTMVAPTEVIIRPPRSGGFMRPRGYARGGIMQRGEFIDKALKDRNARLVNRMQRTWM